MTKVTSFVVLLAISLLCPLPSDAGLSANNNINTRFGRAPKYFFYPGRFTQENARVICKGHDARIASIKSESDQAQAASALAGDAWIGLRRNTSCPSGWNWDDFSCMEFGAWEQGQPDNRGAEENCAMMWLGSKKWHDHKCTSETGVLCQIV